MAKSNTRWFGVGAVIAALLGGALVWIVSLSDTEATSTTEVTIPPCRIADTRPGDRNVGSRNTPLSADETHTFVVRADHRSCTIPDAATAVSFVVTVYLPTERSEMTVWPSDATRPVAADLVYSAGRTSVAAELTERLSAAGTLDVHHDAGSVHLSIDVTAYFVPGGDDRLGTPTIAPGDDDGLAIGGGAAQAVDAAERDLTGRQNATDTDATDPAPSNTDDESTTTGPRPTVPSAAPTTAGASPSTTGASTSSTTPASTGSSTIAPISTAPASTTPASTTPASTGSSTIAPSPSTSVPATTAAPTTTVRPREERVVYVALSGGDFTRVQPALDSITTATADARWLVRIAPGVYDGAFTLKNHVDVEGAGQASTTVRAGGGNTDPVAGSASATIRADGTVDAEVRNLTVVAEGGTFAAGIRTQGAGGSLRFSQVTVRASGGTRSDGVVNVSSSPRMNGMSITGSGARSANHGVVNVAGASPSMSNLSANGVGSGSSSNVGVVNQDRSSPAISGVTATATGGQSSVAIRARGGSSPAISSVTATASGAAVTHALAIESSTPSVVGSRLVGATASISNQSAGGFAAVDVESSQLSGPLVGDGFFTCVGATDAAGNVLGDECR